MRHLFVFIIAVFLGSNLKAQTDRKDSLRAELSTGLISSSKDFLPFHFIQNQYGELTEDTRGYFKGNLIYSRKFSPDLLMTTGLTFRNDVFSRYFVNFELGGLFLNIGRFYNELGGLNNNLSTGSLGLSRNALPVPMISGGISEFVNVPYTDEYLQFKGHLSHGWLERNRHITKALLHSKSFYLQLNLERFAELKIHSGVVHFAQYGGVSPDGEEQANGFKDYLRVFTGSGIPNPNGTTAGESNALGNHLGIVETTIETKISGSRVRLNYQKPFEDEGSLQYISLTDYLIGLEIDTEKRNSIFRKIYVEYLQTKWQGGPGLPDPADNIQTQEDNFGYPFGQRDDMYNNWLYRDGWTYRGLTLGNPLFLTFQRTLEFFALYPDYGVAISNNRITAIHFGLEGSLLTDLDYRFLFTRSLNFGTYSGLYQGRFRWDGAATDPNFEYVFRPGRIQNYSLLELSYPIKKVKINLQMAYDFGQLYNNFGAQVQLNYALNSK